MSRSLLPLFLALVVLSVAYGYDWDYMNCHNHGVYIGQSANLTTDFCNCTKGWTGVDCSICASDASCGNGTYCNNGLQISSKKSYSCVAPAFLNAQNESISLEFDLQTGTGNITVYARLTGAPLEFNCTVGNCTTSGGTVICENTTCLCTTWCSVFVNSLVSTIKGKTSFACDPHGACSLVNAPLLSSKFQCIASSCDAMGPSTATSSNSTYQTATSSNSTHQSETISKGPTYQTTIPSNPGNQTHATGVPSGSSGPCTTIPKQDCIEVCGAGNVKVCQCIHGEPYVECITGASALLAVSWILASLAVLLA